VQHDGIGRTRTFIAAERVGARIIDNVLVTETGAELLSDYPLDLIEIG
jgi:Xaa-Pro aminopeptidase